VAHLAGRIAVMYLGAIVEEGTRAEVLERPAHPYTRALLAAVPRLGAAPGARTVRLAGDVPSPLRPPPGCPFHTRCPEAGPRCRREIPAVTELGPGRRVRCHLATGGVA